MAIVSGRKFVLSVISYIDYFIVSNLKNDNQFCQHSRMENHIVIYQLGRCGKNLSTAQFVMTIQYSIVVYGMIYRQTIKLLSSRVLMLYILFILNDWVGNDFDVSSIRISVVWNIFKCAGIVSPFQ